MTHVYLFIDLRGLGDDTRILSIDLRGLGDDTHILVHRFTRSR